MGLLLGAAFLAWLALLFTGAIDGFIFFQKWQIKRSIRRMGKMCNLPPSEIAREVEQEEKRWDTQDRMDRIIRRP
jgi:hypothetical protein